MFCLFAKTISCLILSTLGNPFLLHGILLIRSFRGLFLYPLDFLNIVSLNTVLTNRISKETSFLQYRFLFSVARFSCPPCLLRSCTLLVCLRDTSSPSLWLLPAHLPKFHHPWEYKQNRLFPKVHNYVGYEVWHWTIWYYWLKFNILCYIVCPLKEKNTNYGHLNILKELFLWKALFLFMAL